MKYYIFIGILALAFTLNSCKKEENKTESYGTVEMIFTPKSGNEAIRMGQTITTPANEDLTINEIKFFVSQLAMVDLDGVEYPAEPLEGDSCQAGIWLVDFTNPNYNAGYGNISYRVSFKVPAGEYADNRFAVDVPRSYNLADITTNPYPLNGSNGMYWSWNSGFKFFVLNGVSSAIGGRPVHLSIGQGFRAVQYNFRSMLLAAQRPTINVEADKTTRLTFEYDINSLLTNADGTPYSFVAQEGSPNPSQVHGGELSTVLQANSSSAIEMIEFKIMSE